MFIILTKIKQKDEKLQLRGTLKPSQNVVKIIRGGLNSKLVLKVIII